MTQPNEFDALYKKLAGGYVETVLTKEAYIQIHDRVMKRYCNGMDPEIRSMDAIEFIVGTPCRLEPGFTARNGTVYPNRMVSLANPDIFTRAAFIFTETLKNVPFKSGNEIVAHIAAVQTLAINDYQLTLSAEKVMELLQKFYRAKMTGSRSEAIAVADIADIFKENSIMRFYDTDKDNALNMEETSYAEKH